MSETGSRSENPWPFEHELEDAEVIQLAQEMHANGFSWPHAISKSLMHFAFDRSKITLQTPSNQSRTNFAYLNLLGAIQSAENVIAEGNALTLEERELLFEEAPVPIDIEVEIFLEDDRHATELKRDPSAISLLKKLIIERMNQQAALDPQVGKLVEENKITSFEDLTSVPNLVDKSPNNAARVRAVSDYERIYNLVTQNQVE